MLAQKSSVASRASLPSRLFVAVALVAGTVTAVAGLGARPAEAQIDPLRTPLTQTTTGVFQYPGGSWGWERVQVGEIYVEQTGIAGAVQHWVLFRDYSPALPFELAPSGARYADLADFLATSRDRGAAHVPVADELRRCEPTPTCVTLTRGRDGGVADALIRRDEPDRNFGGSGSLSVTEGASVRRALLRFDTRRIPAGAVVVSADLALHGLLYGAATSVTPVLAPWDEATVTWASFARAGEALGAGAAGPYLDRTTAVLPLTPPGAVASTSLVALVQAWVDGALANDGLMVGRRGADASVVYASSENPDPALRPALTVCYQTCADNCGRVCADGLVCAAGECREPEGTGCTVAGGERECGGNGVCAYDRCFCDPGFSGATCAISDGCPDDCGGHGVCHFGQCFCEPGYEGPACGGAPACPDDCSGNGVCLDGTCYCLPGFGGDRCTARCE